MERKRWFEHYGEGVPHTLRPYPEHTLVDVVREVVRQRPDHAALLFQGARLSYAELDRLSDAFAAALTARGRRRRAIAVAGLFAEASEVRV